MVVRGSRAAIVFAFGLVLSGCACLTVTKLSPVTDIISATKGQRFSLPRPYIQVTPKEDGSISADIVYLPDPEHSYAVSSFSIFANDILEVYTADGIVTQINWMGDSSAVVADAIASAGTVASGILQAEQAKKADQKAKDETAIKTVDDAQLELDLAQSALAFHIASNAAPDKILEARLAVQAATLKLSAAQTALARMRGVAGSAKDAANRAVSDALSELTHARSELENRVKEGAASETIKQAQSVVDDAQVRLNKAQAELAKVTGQMFGPKLFAIREEIRNSAGGKPSPYLQIVTVQQQTEPPDKGWNPSQPKYPVKLPEQ